MFDNEYIYISQKVRLMPNKSQINVLTDFLTTGTYDKNREFFKTISPSMDILISSNLERLIYKIAGADAEKDAAAGKPDAVRLMDEFGVNIGRLVKVIMYAFDPHVIVFGGSIANAFDLFKSSMWSELSTFPYGESLRHLRIFRSMTPDIGLLGAGSLCD